MRTCLVRLVARPVFTTQRHSCIPVIAQRRLQSSLDDDGNTAFYHALVLRKANDATLYIPGRRETVVRGIERFIDAEELGHDCENWLNVLRQKERIDGRDGIWQTWICMRRACIDMPIDGATARNLWSTYLRNPELHELVFSHAVNLRSSNSSSFPPLYELLMRHHLLSGSDPEIVALWHQRFTAEYYIPKDALPALAVAATQSTGSLRAFKGIYKDLTQHSQTKYDHVYDQLIPALLRKGMYRQATSWHTILERQNDGVSSDVARNFTLSEFQRFRSEISSSSSSRSSQIQAPTLTSTSIRRSPPSATDVKESVETPAPQGLFANLFGGFDVTGNKEFSDEFCARLFATKALTPAWISAFLEAFGVKKIGPLALRELAVQSESCAHLRMNIEDLRDAGITLGLSVFSRAVAKFAAEDEEELLRGLIHSDQHPVGLEDNKTQQSILTQYLKEENQQGAHRTLTLLSMFHSKPELKYWNILLRHHIHERNVKAIMEIADTMLLKKVPLSGHTLRLAARHLLRHRERGHRPTATGKGFDDLSLVTNLVFLGLRAGTTIDEFIWVELFKRHGMAGFSHLSRFCHAMVSEHLAMGPDSRHGHMPNRDNYQTMMASLPFGAGSHMLRHFFSSRRLRYVIEWGFEHALEVLHDVIAKAGRHQTTGAVRYRRWPVDLAPPPPPATFLMGLLLVQNLAEKGLVVPVDAVRRAVKIRLWILYGPGRSRRRKNRTVKALNPYSVVELLDAVHRAWTGPPLFPDIQKVIESADHAGKCKEPATVARNGRYNQMEQHREAELDSRIMLQLFGSRRMREHKALHLGNESWAYRGLGRDSSEGKDMQNVQIATKKLGDERGKRQKTKVRSGSWASDLPMDEISG